MVNTEFEADVNWNKQQHKDVHWNNSIKHHHLTMHSVTYSSSSAAFRCA